MLDAGALVKKYRGKGVFLDTNLLVLLLVGLVNKGRIQRFKRTQDLTVEDFRLLERLVEWFGAPIISTPHVLSQVSDLTDLPGPELLAIRRRFRDLIAAVEEQYDVAKDLVIGPWFERFGLGDASVAAVCKRGVLVLTADVQLQVALAYSGLDALNFNHVRRLGSSSTVLTT